MSNIGSITWIMLHSFAAKIKPEIFVEQRSAIFNFIKELYSTYRCVRCRKDALEYLNSYTSIESSEEFKMYLFNFHTSVNRKLSKTYYDINNLTNYEKTNIQNIINKFIIRYRPNKSIELFLTSHFDWFN